MAQTASFLARFPPVFLTPTRLAELCLCLVFNSLLTMIRLRAREAPTPRARSVNPASKIVPYKSETSCQVGTSDMTVWRTAINRSIVSNKRTASGLASSAG